MVPFKVKSSSRWPFMLPQRPHSLLANASQTVTCTIATVKRLIGIAMNRLMGIATKRLMGIAVKRLMVIAMKRLMGIAMKRLIVMG